VHNHNKSNSGQIGEVVVMGGSGKTQDFFLWMLTLANIIITDIIMDGFHSL